MVTLPLVNQRILVWMVQTIASSIIKANMKMIIP